MPDFFASYHFPKGFFWGTATASHQVEGNNHNNNWSRWEQEPGRIINGQTSGLACDWWGGRWKEDLDRAAETGQNAHRMSIEWSRVQPAPDRWDEDAIDHYREMLRGMVTRGLAPLVTLHHFTDPLWLVDRGGWENQEVPELFEKYVSRVVTALKEYCTTWVTINEPNVYVISGYIYGMFPPGAHDMGRALKVTVNIIRGHAAAYHAIHAIQKEARVGFSINYRSFKPAKSWFVPDIIAANLQKQFFNDTFPVAAGTGLVRNAFLKENIPQAKGTQDFLGVNYYSRDLVAFTPGSPATQFMRNFFPKGSDLSPTGFIANVPEGLYEGLHWGLRFGVPMMVTENGVEDAPDTLRPRYTLQHIHQVWRAVNFNWPVKGYFHWSLVDNFEWERGWTQRFGLWGLNTETQARIRNKSVDLYEAICRENGITSDMVRKYAPEVLEAIFPV